MEVRRTVPVTLDVDSDDAALLEDTVDAFLWSAQYVVDHVSKSKASTSQPAKPRWMTKPTTTYVRKQTASTAVLSKPPETKPLKPAKASSHAGRTARRRRSHT